MEKRVLIFDDALIMRRIIKETAEEAGRVVACDDILEAARRWRKKVSRPTVDSATLIRADRERWNSRSLMQAPCGFGRPGCVAESFVGQG